MRRWPLLAVCMALACPAMADEISQQAARTISRYRASQNLPAVRIDDRLIRAAREQNAAMIQLGTVSHDAAGEFAARVRRHGIKGLAAENLAAGHTSLAHVMDDWTTSSGHNANLLNPGISRIGMARSAGPGGQLYWTLVLAR